MSHGHCLMLTPLLPACSRQSMTAADFKKLSERPEHQPPKRGACARVAGAARRRGAFGRTEPVLLLQLLLLPPPQPLLHCTDPRPPLPAPTPMHTLQRGARRTTSCRSVPFGRQSPTRRRFMAPTRRSACSTARWRGAGTCAAWAACCRTRSTTYRTSRVRHRRASTAWLVLWRGCTRSLLWRGGCCRCRCCCGVSGPGCAALTAACSRVHPAGVTSPMCYFGMWKSFFGWHKEDIDLVRGWGA